jgi:hypothetical protein
MSESENRDADLKARTNASTMAEPPGNACWHMDDEFVVAATHAAMGAATNLLNCLTADQASAQPELDQIAQDLAMALDTVISFMPKRDEETNQLLGALQRWLP